MSKLREKLKTKAQLELGAIVRDASSALEGLHPEVSAEEIAALAFSKRTATLEKKVISRMIAKMEEEVLDQYVAQFVVVVDGAEYRGNDEDHNAVAPDKKETANA